MLVRPPPTGGANVTGEQANLISSGATNCCYPDYHGPDVVFSLN